MIFAVVVATPLVVFVRGCCRVELTLVDMAVELEFCYVICGMRYGEKYKNKLFV